MSRLPTCDTPEWVRVRAQPADPARAPRCLQEHPRSLSDRRAIGVRPSHLLAVSPTRPRLNRPNHHCRRLWTVLTLLAIIGHISTESAYAGQPGFSLQAQLQGHAAYCIKEPVVVRFLLFNRTAEPLRVLRWGTPLEGSFTRDMFAIEYIDDASLLPYRGPSIRRSLPAATDYLIIAPGDIAWEEIDLSQGYALTKTGRYRVQFRPTFIQFYPGTHSSIASEQIQEVKTNSIDFTLERRARDR